MCGFALDCNCLVQFPGETLKHQRNTITVKLQATTGTVTFKSEYATLWVTGLTSDYSQQLTLLPLSDEIPLKLCTS